ncbi:MAG: carbamoyl-phosphate synthase (glutamine-hydrolyzing) large subunit [Thermocladium sp.]
MGDIRSVLVVGSGPIKVAEAAEFDYSGSQALKAFREEGLETILINSNVATVQTSKGFADKLYMVPVTPEFAEKVIERERPDAVAIGFGGQTALTVGVELEKRGVLRRYGIKVLGTPIEGIEKALSRERFRETMIKVGLPVPPSASARSVDDAISAARELGYPVMMRVSFNLGGRGSMIAWSEPELVSNVDRAFSQSHIHEVLIERYLHHWKELEYEVVRDSHGNSVVVACLENLDPMGIHTGESVVIAPCQTLDDYEYQEMRRRSISVAEAIGLVGESNVQFALDPRSYANYVIETNPRMSRSSALASKATGYPLAYVAAKLSLGYGLDEVINKVTGSTCSCFEPSLDYVVIKMPRWDLGKFDGVEDSLGSEMKSIGEVMSIGRSFEEAMQKAIRMLDIGEPGLVGGSVYESSESLMEALDAIRSRKPYWFLHVAKAFREGGTIESVAEASGVDPFFLRKIKEVVDLYESMRGGINLDKLVMAKRLGFSDEQIARITGVGEDYVRKMRRGAGLRPSVKQVDTLAGEWPATTNYLYMTYNGGADDVELDGGDGLLILGAGVFRIGVSVEFDWGVVSLLNAARGFFNKVAVLNYNPETVSTDWDVSGYLFFDEVSMERVLDVVEKGGFSVVSTFVGGQLGNNVAKPLEERGIKLLGTAGHGVDAAENREKFSRLLDKLGLRQPPWVSASSINELRGFVDGAGFPVLVRPSYVLSGSWMKVINNEEELMGLINRLRPSPSRPIVVSKFMEGAMEAEIDAVSDGRGVLGVVLEHIEEAGTHSGDATMSIPRRDLPESSVRAMKEGAVMLAREINVRGPFNLQFMVKDGEPFIIELNLRASRSMPFTSKAVGINLIHKSMEAIMRGLDVVDFMEPPSKSWAVKSPQFSWTQLRGAYPVLGPEMRSTGEAASLGTSFSDALLKSWLSVSPNRLPRMGESILVYGCGTGEAGELLRKQGFDVVTLRGAESLEADALSAEEAAERIRRGGVGLVITHGDLRSLDYRVRRAAVDFNVPLVLNAKLGRELAKAIGTEVSVKEVEEYGGGAYV